MTITPSDALSRDMTVCQQQSTHLRTRSLFCWRRHSSQGHQLSMRRMDLDATGSTFALSTLCVPTRAREALPTTAAATPPRRPPRPGRRAPLILRRLPRMPRAFTCVVLAALAMAQAVEDSSLTLHGLSLPGGGTQTRMMGATFRVAAIMLGSVMRALCVQASRPQRHE